MQRFFKTGPGQYGEGDEFMGLKVSTIRQLIKSYYDLSYGDLTTLLIHPVHEIRMTGLLILVKQYQKNRIKNPDHFVEIYLDHLDYVNNWDLVDSSCRDLLGDYLLTRPRDLLYQLAKENNIWKQRIAIVSTYPMIKKGDFTDAFAISLLLFAVKEDILQKGIGWMLREIVTHGGLADFESFVKSHADKIPRKTLSIAIQDLDKNQKEYFRGLLG